MKKLWMLVLAFVLAWGLCAQADAPDEEAAVQALAAELLPGYVLQDGDVQEDAACFLVLRPEDGATLFAGCTKMQEEWLITLSAPLPENPGLDTFHGSGDYAILFFYDAELAALSEEIFGDPEFCWKTCVLTPDLDGAWRVETIGWEWGACSLTRCTLESSDDTRLWWGTPNFDLNAATLDWAALPDTLDEALARMNLADWVVLTAPTPLLTAPDGASIGLYNAGTGLRVLARQDAWLHVAVADGAITGWVEADAVIPAAENICTYEDEWTENLYIPPYYSLRYGEPPVPLMDADGQVIYQFGTKFRGFVMLLADCGATRHVFHPDTGLDGFVSAADCEPW